MKKLWTIKNGLACAKAPAKPRPSVNEGGLACAKAPAKPRRSVSEGGFTLVEVLVSVAILLLMLPSVASIFNTNRIWSSYSRHKIEAAYAAQEIIELERQGAFVTPPKTITGSVILDTKGNYNNTTCTTTGAFCGTSTITFTSEVYTNSAGKTTTSSTVDHMVVAISWWEQSFKTKTTMTETYAADIVNDPMLN